MYYKNYTEISRNSPFHSFICSKGRRRGSPGKRNSKENSYAQSPGLYIIFNI